MMHIKIQTKVFYQLFCIFDHCLVIDKGNVQWYANVVHLASPTVSQCEDAVTLMEKEQTETEWCIILSASSSESALVIINNLNKCPVKELDIINTPLDGVCVTTLSEILVRNKKLLRLNMNSSPPAGGIKQVSEALFTNTTLEILEAYNVTITDEDLTHLFEMLSVNKTLKGLDLSNCHITDNGIHYISEVFAKNQTLTSLDISHNPLITSVSASKIVEIISTTVSLTVMHLQYTSLKVDDIEAICSALNANTTIQKLILSKQHSEICEKFDCFQSIKDRIIFL